MLKRRSERYYYEWEARQILLDSPSVVLRETNSLDEILTHLNRYPVGPRIPLGVLEARDRKYCICRLEHIVHLLAHYYDLLSYSEKEEGDIRDDGPPRMATWNGELLDEL